MLGAGRPVLGALALAAAAAGLGAPAASGAQARIIGGKPATREYPHQAYVRAAFGSRRALCGGTLVAARYVVTAGHCVTGDLGESPDAVEVVLGTATSPATAPPANRYEAVAVTRHPGYDEADGAPTFDVAVLELDRPAPEAQARLVRPHETALWAPGVVARVIGWGDTDPDPAVDAPAETLNEVDVPVVDDRTCAAYAAFDAAVMVCAGLGDGRDSCQGDSGGPLLVPDHDAYAFAGITSFGAECGTAPGVYARIGSDPLNAWLREQVPQVEIDPSSATPQPGEIVTFTATGRHVTPGGDPALGGYEAMGWDTDGDGAFDDAAGTTAAVTMQPGLNVVSVQATRENVPATDADDDAEVRAVRLQARYRSPVGFAAPAVAVAEGDVATLSVVRSGGPGAGTVTATPSPLTAGLGGIDVTGGAAVLAFDAGRASQVVTFATVEDGVDEPDETFRVDLGAHTGELVAGQPGAVTVTIVDDDEPPPPALSLNAKRRIRPSGRKPAFKVAAVVSEAGTLRAVARDTRRRKLATTVRAVRAVAAGRRRLTLRLTRRGRRELARKRRVKVIVTVTFRAARTTPPVTARRVVYLRGRPRR